ncbi:MAG: hypothetical protein IPM38_00350 [Ignavibacteria bacterium]|nr:hypothetical protein [Ignavibacteria bacterium]
MNAENTSSKKNLLISLILFVSVLSLFFTGNNINNAENSNSAETANPLDSFVIGAMGDAYGEREILRDSLKFNTWHTYTNFEDGGWIHGFYNGIPGDTTFADSSTYYQGIKNIIEINHNYDMKTMMDRPKTSYLAWGQRSDYQCEETIADDVAGLYL